MPARHHRNTQKLMQQTPSERYLAKLSKQSFLSLWSYPNLYTDESKGPKGDGKEFCDLTAIFGNHVLLFSDKHIAFSLEKPLSIAWPRWYRRAVTNSARQLLGAESWIRRFPGRLFLDRSCTYPMPLGIAASSELIVHKIVIANGASTAIQKHTGKPFPSLLVSSDDASNAAKHPPFTALQPFKQRGYIHVLDEVTMDLLMRELDTASDFVQYLQQRERNAMFPGREIQAVGEEDLLAVFMQTFVDRKHQIILPDGMDVVVIAPGSWDTFKQSPEYKGRLEANVVSYKWDQLIESISSHILSGRIESPFRGMALNSVALQELGIRQMAAEGRMRRRQLARWMMEGAEIARDRQQFGRMVAFHNEEPPRGYALKFVKPLESETNYESYRERRLVLLYAEMLLCKLKFPVVESVLGTTSEGIYHGPVTEDIMFMQCANWTQKNYDDATARLAEYGVGQDATKLVNWAGSEIEFPKPAH